MMSQRWWWRLLRYARPGWRGLLGLLALVGLVVALEALRPWPVKLAVDHVLEEDAAGAAPLDWLPGAEGPAALLAWLAVGVVAIALGLRLAHLLQTWLKAWLGQRLVYALGGDVFGRLLDSSRAFHANQRTGDLVRRVNADCTCVRDIVMSVAIPIVQSLLTLLVIFIVMWRLDWLLALVALAVAGPMGVMIRLFAGPMTERSYEQAQRSGELMTVAEQTLGVVPVVQAFRREDHEHGRFRQAGERTVRATLRALASQLHFRLGVSAATAVGTATILLVGGYRALEGRITVGDLYVFLAYLVALYAPLETLAYLSSGFASAKAKARRVFEVLDHQDPLTEPVKPRALPPPPPGPARRVTFERVSFAYAPGTPVLEDVALTIEPGERVALVGATGAGKSTLASLVPRFADPTAGAVHMDGVNLRELARADVRSQVAWLPQEPTLLPMSIADNIAYGRPGATRDEIVAAAEAAGAHAFITRLPEGYDTVIGERGATLSGGENQRLAIARALLKDAPIVLLDEPTAALDAETEASVMAAIERLTTGRTTLMIAHRLSTVRRADRIVVMDHGRIIEAGTHEQLLEKDGAYARFHASDDPHAPRATAGAPGTADAAQTKPHAASPSAPPSPATRPSTMPDTTHAPINAKVFGIGLSKTGTTSLGLALNRLGIPTIDFPHDPVTLRQLEQGDYRLRVLERCQAVTDTPVAPYYAQLDALYPRSKFILTVRDKESWLRSVEDHWKFSAEWAEHHRDFRRFTYFMHVAVYGAYAFERNRFAHVYDQHTRNVMAYFHDRPDDLLVLDVCSGEGWEKLCPFLGLPVPEEPFPQSNTREEKARRRAWMSQLAQAQHELEQVVPPDATLALVDDGQFAGSDLAYARPTLPFTEVGGVYNGPPADSTAARHELQRLREAGVDYLVFAWPAFWWLDHYQAFHEHLRESYACRSSNGRLVIFDLNTARRQVSMDPVSQPRAPAAHETRSDRGTELDAMLTAAQHTAQEVDIQWADDAIDRARWTLTHDALRFIAGLTLHLQPRHVLELGSGLSTRLFCRLGERLSQPLTVTSIDHDPDYGTAAAAEANRGVEANVQLRSIEAPLVVRTCCDRPMPMYHLSPESLMADAGPADLVLIDGPPAPLGGREGTLYQIMDHARPGTIVVLDDACRAAEQRILRRWQDNLGDAVEVRVLDHLGPGLAVIAVRQPVPRHELWNHRLALTARDLANHVPADAMCVFVDGGQLDARALGREVHPFIERDQQDWGAPANDAAALAELAHWRERHLRYLAFAWSAFWWLDHYQGLHDHLQREAQCVLRNDRLVIYELTPRYAESRAR